jgi:high-affinity K+ transport system ATPase subunit B
MDILSDFADFTPLELGLLIFGLVLALLYFIAVVRGLVLCFSAGRTMAVLGVFAIFILIGTTILAFFGAVRLVGGADLPKRLAVAWDI